MRAGAYLAGVAALVVAACGPSSPGPSGELAAVLNFGAYPRATQVDEWYSVNGGPVPMPGNYGWREYRTDDQPMAVRAHYEQLAKANGWLITPASVPPDLGLGGNNHVAQLDFKGRTLRVFVSQQAGSSGMMGPVRPPEYTPSPSPLPSGASPTPLPSIPPGPWYVRTEGQVQWR